MKLSFSTVMCMDSAADDLAGLCKKYGFDGVEVRAYDSDDFLFGENVNITNIGTSICIRKYDEALLLRAKNILQEVEKRNIPAIRVFLGNFFRTYDAPREPVVYDEIVKMLQAMCDATSVEIWIETHNEFATGKVLSKLLSDVNRKNLKIIWDIIHPIEDGESPEETIKYLGDKIAHVHIKDGRKSSDPNQHDYIYTPIGEGELPICEIKELLIQNNYDGYFSLEWESLWRGELQALKLDTEDVLSSFVKFIV